MFTEKMIRNVIKEYIDSGISKFVIYPFGSNGMLVNNCMEQCFGISLVMIVDNGKLNFKLKEGLLSFVPQDRIVNLYDLAYKERIKIGEFENFNQVGNRFSLEKILPQTKNVLHNSVSEGKNQSEIYASCAY